MQKTVYQTPELRDSNDNIIQQGAFGKNTALSNSTNDGWIDYMMNNLEALHDVVGETSPTLDANGHVVEPANLAIGDEDGNRIKNSYLKLSGGKVTGVASFRTDLRMLDNQDNRWGGLYVPGTTSSVQYLSLYSGTRATGDARLNLYSTGNGKFELTGYSTDGANAYTLTHDNSGNLKWRGTNIALANAFLPLSGGTMTGAILGSGGTLIAVNKTTSYLQINGGQLTNDGAKIILFGKDEATRKGYFYIDANDGTNLSRLAGFPDGALTWNNKNIHYGESSINATYKDGYTIDRTTNTVKQWRRQTMNAGASYTWTFAKPFDSNVYITFLTSNNGTYPLTITERTATSMTIQNNGSGQALVNMMAIGISAS